MAGWDKSEPDKSIARRRNLYLRYNSCANANAPQGERGVALAASSTAAAAAVATGFQVNELGPEPVQSGAGSGEGGR